MGSLWSPPSPALLGAHGEALERPGLLGLRQARAEPIYEPHRPQETLLHKIVSEHLDDGKLPRASVGQRLLAKSAHVKGFAVKHYLKTGLFAGMKLIRGVSRNKIKAVIDPHVFEGIESIPDAVEHHNAGKNIGKVLIRLS